MFKVRAPVLLLGWFLLAALGGEMLFRATPLGIGVSIDSNRYFLMQPWHPQDHQYPPLYPAILQACQGVLGESIFWTARCFGSLIFSVNIATSGLVVFLASGSIRMSLLACLMVLLSSASQGVHSWAWSEPLFFFLGNLLCLFLALFRQGGQRLYLLAACCFGGLALLTRYAAGAWIVSGVIFLLRGRSRKRLGEAGLFLSATVPLALWMQIPIPNLLQPSRHLAWHPPGQVFFQVALETASTYIGNGLAAWQFPLVCLATWSLVCRHPRKRSPRVPQLLVIWGWFLPVYLLYLWLSAWFLDALVIPDTRLLSPFWMILMQLILSQAARFRLLAFAAMLQCFNALAPAALYFETLKLSGQGYTSSTWADSALLHRVERLPAGALIYTNDPNPFQVHSGRSVNYLAPPTDLMGGAPDPLWKLRWSEMLHDVRRHGTGFYVAVNGTETFPVPPGWQVFGRNGQGCIFLIVQD